MQVPLRFDDQVEFLKRNLISQLIESHWNEFGFQFHFLVHKNAVRTGFEFNLIIENCRFGLVSTLVSIFFNSTFFCRGRRVAPGGGPGGGAGGGRGGYRVSRRWLFQKLYLRGIEIQRFDSVLNDSHHPTIHPIHPFSTGR